jgi:hypothetical protein
MRWGGIEYGIPTQKRRLTSSRRAATCGAVRRDAGPPSIGPCGGRPAVADPALQHDEDRTTFPNHRRRPSGQKEARAGQRPQAGHRVRVRRGRRAEFLELRSVATMEGHRVRCAAMYALRRRLQSVAPPRDLPPHSLPAADLFDVALPPAQQAHSAAPGRSTPLSAHRVGAPLAGNENPRLGIFRRGNRGPSSTTRSWRTAGGHRRPGGSGAHTKAVTEDDLADDAPTGVPLSLPDATRQYATSSTTQASR